MTASTRGETDLFKERARIAAEEQQEIVSLRKQVGRSAGMMALIAVGVLTLMIVAWTAAKWQSDPGGILDEILEVTREALGKLF